MSMLARRQALFGVAARTPTLLAHVAAASASNTAAPVTSAINTTGASVLFAVCVGYPGGGSVVIAPTDSMGNTWIALTAEVDVGGIVRTNIFYCATPTVGAGHTFSTTGAGNNIFASVLVAAFGNALAVSADHQNGNSVDSGTANQVGGVTPSVNGEILITGVGYNSNASSFTVDSGFTITDQTNAVGGSCLGGAFAYLIQGAASPVNPTWTCAAGFSQSASKIATFTN